MISFKELTHIEPHLSLLPIATFIIGILTYFTLSFEPSFFIISAAVVLFAGLLFLKLSAGQKFCITLLLFFFLGLLICCIHTALNSNRFISAPLLKVTVSGKVIDTEKNLNYTQLDIKVYDITQQDKTLQTEKSVFPLNKMPKIVRLYSSESDIQIGDYIAGSVTALTPPDMPLTPFGQNEARLLWFDHISAVGSVYQIKVINRAPPKESIFTALNNIIRQRFLKNLSEENVGIALSLVSGSAEYITTSSRLLYRDLGISHILSVSGFHIGLIAFFVFCFVRFLLNLIFSQLSGILIKRIAVLTAAGVCLFYVFLSGAQAPAVRSYLMVCAVMLAVLFDKRAISIRNLFFAAFLILCFKPVLLMHISFQLSFIAVLCITGVYTHFQKQLKAQPFFQKTGLFLSNYLAFNFLVTLATTPFVLYVFHQLSVFTVLGNVLLSSLFAFAVIPLLFLSVITLVIPPVSDMLLHGADMLLSLVSFIGMPLSGFAHTTFYAPYFYAYGLVLWTIGLIGLAVFQSRVRYVFILCFLLAFTAFFGVEKPVAFIGAGGQFVGYRNRNTYYETESYYFKALNQAWMTYAGLNPEKHHLKPLLPNNSPLIGLNAQNCAKALLSVYTDETMRPCPHLIYPHQIYAWQTLLIFEKNKSYHLRRACETNKYRPWRVGCPEKPYFYLFK